MKCFKTMKETVIDIHMNRWESSQQQYEGFVKPLKCDCDIDVGS